ncbi:MAG: 2-oxoacid:acceptor oxidoreductase family protein [Bacillota bacterium]
MTGDRCSAATPGVPVGGGGEREWQVVIGGEGGQGVVLAGALLGEAAVRAGLNAAHTSAYGIATRGGFTRSDVIVVPGEREILYPLVRRPDLLVALSEQAYERLVAMAGPGAILIREAGLKGPACAPDAREGACAPWREIALPLGEVAVREGGRRMVNVAALGAAVGVAGMFAPVFLEEVLRRRFGSERGEASCRAMRAGYRLVSD